MWNTCPYNTEILEAGSCSRESSLLGCVNSNVAKLLFLASICPPWPVNPVWKKPLEQSNIYWSSTVADLLKLNHQITSFTIIANGLNVPRCGMLASKANAQVNSIPSPTVQQNCFSASQSPVSSEILRLLLEWVVFALLLPQSVECERFPIVLDFKCGKKYKLYAMRLPVHTRCRNEFES